MSKTTVLVLNTVPEPDRCEEIAWYEAFGYETFLWEILNEIPEGIDVDVSDQLVAHKRDAGPDACYMKVWMTND